MPTANHDHAFDPDGVTDQSMCIRTDEMCTLTYGEYKARPVASPTQDELARQLINLVRETTAPEAVLLQRRIDATLGYLSGIATPNEITLKNVRAFLTGEHDDELEFWIEGFKEFQE